MKVAFCLVILIFSIYASGHVCSTDERLEKFFEANPDVKELVHAKYSQYRERERATSSIGKRDHLPLVRIPVVWHILYDESEPATELPVAAIQREMDYVNDWFTAKNVYFEDTSDFFAGSIAQSEDFRIQFELASFDPAGNPTDGITYHETPVALTCDFENTFSSSDGGVDVWNTEEYLNIYTCFLVDGILGFASFPFFDSPDTDGIVLYFGLVGEPEPFAGTVLAHEIGHYLGVFHAFQGGCGGDGDFVDDTPETPGPAFDFVNPYLPCPGINGAESDNFIQCDNVVMVQNVMDYNYATCNTCFSKGQAAVMRFWVDNFSIRSKLANSPALSTPCSNFDCTGKQCGDDGCDGRCGLCDTENFEECINNQCVRTNLPCPTYDCSDKQCGDDGCGGSCGSCISPQFCNDNRVCESPNAVCSDSIELFPPQTVTGANFGDLTPIPCDDFPLDNPIWFRVRPEASGILVVDTLGSNFDTTLGVFRGSCNDLVCVEANDDIILYYFVLSEVAIPVSAGTDYFIALAGYAGSFGEYTLNVELNCDNYDCDGKQCGTDGCGGSCGTCSDGLLCSDDQICAFPNSQCESPQDIQISGQTGEELSFFAANFADSQISICTEDFTVSNPLWYTISGAQEQFIILTAIGSTFDTTIAVYEGSCNDLTCVAFNDDFFGLLSALAFILEPNTEYFIAIGGFSDRDRGEVALNVIVQCASFDCVGKQCGSDGCGGSCGTCGDDFFCNDSDLCEFIPPCPSYDCTNKNCGPDQCGGQCGTCDETQSCNSFGVCESPNDSCIDSTPIEISVDGNFYPGYVSYSTTDSIFCGSEEILQPIWFRFSVPEDKQVYLSVNQDRFSSSMAVFTGSCGALSCETASYFSNKPYVAAEVLLNARAGETYFIAVGVFYSYYSDFFLEALEISTIPSNTATGTPRPLPTPSSSSQPSNAPSGTPQPSNAPSVTPQPSSAPPVSSDSSFSSVDSSFSSVVSSFSSVVSSFSSVVSSFSSVDSSFSSVDPSFSSVTSGDSSSNSRNSPSDSSSSASNIYFMFTLFLLALFMSL